MLDHQCPDDLILDLQRSSQPDLTWCPYIFYLTRFHQLVDILVLHQDRPVIPDHIPGKGLFGRESFKTIFLIHKEGQCKGIIFLVVEGNKKIRSIKYASQFLLNGQE